MKKSKQESTGAAALARSTAKKAESALRRMESEVMPIKEHAAERAHVFKIIEHHSRQLVAAILGIKTTNAAVAQEEASRLTNTQIEALRAELEKETPDAREG